MNKLDPPTTRDALTIEQALAMSENNASLRVCPADQLEELTLSGWHVLAVIPDARTQTVIEGRDGKSVVVEHANQLAFLLGRHEQDTISALYAQIEALERAHVNEREQDRIKIDQLNLDWRRLKDKLDQAHEQLERLRVQEKLKLKQIAELQQELLKNRKRGTASVFGLWKP